MKKIKYFLLIVVSILLITGCGNKKAIDSSKFIKTMTDLDFKIVNVKEQFNDVEEIKEAYVALNKDMTYQIEFYILDNKENAKSFYDNNKSIFEESKESTSAYTTIDLGNTSKYTLSTGGKYKLLSRIDNTMIYLNVDSEYKNDVNNILKKLGY